MKNKKRIVLIFLIAVMVFVTSFSFPREMVFADDSADNIQDDIDNIKKKIEREENAKAELEAQLAQIQNSVYATQEQINKARELIKESEEKISRMEKDVQQMSERLDYLDGILKNLIQQVYYQKKEALLSMAIFREELGGIFGRKDNIVSVEDRIQQTVKEIRETKESMELEQKKVNEAKSDHEELLHNKVVQQYSLLAERKETQGDIEEKEASLSELQQKMNELRNDLNRILGKSYDTGEIKDAIKFANKVTGVRKGFLFGMLSMESGGNPLAGNCTLKDCDMTSSRKKYFEKICDELDYNDKKCGKMPLSCASKSYPGSGGAMGAAQFMSDTWWKRKDAIASATGHNPPDPWNLLDGVVAMALYLEELGATNDGKVSIKNPCTGKSVNVGWEIYASMRYLGWTCYGYTNYAPGVQSLAKGYDKL